MTSAYPKQLDDLILEAQRLSRELGAIPSQNRLKAALHVRSERARSVLNALKASGFDPTEPGTELPTPLRLQVVPDEPTGPLGELTSDAEAAHCMPAGSDKSEPVPPMTAQDVRSQVKASTEPVPPVVPVDASSWLVRVRRRPSLTIGTGSEEPVAWSRPGRAWPIVLLAAPAFVAIWSGWVGLGALTGFGLVHPLPGIANGFTLNSAITLPVGVEMYAAYALRVWLAIGVGTDERARRFAKWSAVGALVLGAAGQIAYHLMIADHVTTAPWWITTAVSCLPVVVLGFGAALAHLQHPHRDRTEVER